MRSAEQYQMLTSIWQKWRSVAASVAPDPTTRVAVRRRATTAIKALYQFYGRDAPIMAWCEHPATLPLRENELPLICHFRDSLIYAGWHKLAEPAWLCSQVGYDRRQHIFRLPTNKRMVLSRSRLRRRADNGRWLQSEDVGNVISQFDVDALAILELATALGRIDPQIKKLAKIVERIATSCFAAVAFEGYCIAVEKPTSVALNEVHRLSARGMPSIEWQSEGYRLYSINGEVISVNQPPTNSFGDLISMMARQRAMLIEYIGWEEFLQMFEQSAPRWATKISQDKYGTLYRIRFPNQEILVVRVKNRTAEPDGSFRDYVMPVDHLCRPLPHPNKPHEALGDPQPLTARNAVASTFYMTGDEYEQMLGAES